jgi:hypothetical protein
MSAFWDIAVNLLSNAIWATGGYTMSQLFLKKPLSPAPGKKLIFP